MAADVGHDRLVEVVAREPQRGLDHDLAHRDHRDLARAAADVDHHVPGRLGDLEPGADGGGDRLLDQRDLARAGRQARLLDRPRLDLGDAGGHAHDHARARPAARLRLAQEVAQHLLGDLEVGDHAVAQGPRGGDRRGRAADHAVRLVADGVDLAAVGVDRDHRRLGDDDAAAALVDERVRGAEVDGQVAVAERHQPTTSSKALWSTVMRCIPSSSISPSTLNSRARRQVDLDHGAPGVADVALLGDRAAAQAPRAADEPQARARGQDVVSSTPSAGSEAPISEPPPKRAGDRDDRLPGLAVEDLGAVRRTRVQRSGCSTRPRGARRARRRAGRAWLQRLRAARRRRGEPGAGDVDERAPVGEAPELHRPQPLPGGGQHARRLGVERQLRDAGEVVGGPHRDHRRAARRAALRAGAGADRAVAARHGDPLGLRARDAAQGRRGRIRRCDVSAMAAHRGRERLRVEAPTGGPVGDQRDAHAPREGTGAGRLDCGPCSGASTTSAWPSPISRRRSTST